MSINEALKQETEFLEKIGLTYTAFQNGEYPGMLFDGDVLVGYILFDEKGNLCTQIDGPTIKGSYSFTPSVNGIIIRIISMMKNDQEIEICNIHCERDKSDYLDYEIDGEEGYSIRFEPNIISCGLTNTSQNQEINGKCVKGNSDIITKIIERFREITPELIDHYLSKYINSPKLKSKKQSD